MNSEDLRLDYRAGGAADAALPPVSYHVRGLSGPVPGETEDVVFLEQVHGSSVVFDPAGGEEADGMIIPRVRGKSPGIVTADCLPVFLASSLFLAAFHAGWRGIAAGITERMMDEFPGHPEMVVLGNCICPECYRVGEDVRRKVIGTSEEGHPPGRIDLKRAVLRRMLLSGLPESTMVLGIPECTMCRKDLFFSYRRDETTGRNLQWLSAD